MKKMIYKLRILLYILLVILGIFLVSWTEESKWNVIESLIAILGLLGVFYELRSSKILSEGTFITSLNDSFNNNESILRLYKKLELKEEITDDDTIDIVAYLTYFETIYILLKKNIIDLSLIDDLFAYRFRIAIENKTIQRISLVKHDRDYVNIYRLEKEWCRYKGNKTASILKKINPNNYDIIVRGGKTKKHEYLLRTANESDIVEIYEIMSYVYEKLEKKEVFVCDDIEYVETQIKTGGFAVVACDWTGKIVGSFIIRYPEDSNDNLGRELGLEEDELCKVVHMESVIVLPEHRGNNLQFKMLQYAENLVDISKYQYLVATVSPNNPASQRSFGKNGYKIVKTKKKYGGLMRQIYCKEI